MASASRTPRRRVAIAAIAVGIAGLVVVGVIAPPERCPPVTAGELRASATEAVDWFVRNQRPDGRWLYEYDATSDSAIADYNVVRHAGAIMGLYQAAAAGIDGALASADRGQEWAADRMRREDGTAGLSTGARRRPAPPLCCCLVWSNAAC